MKERLSGGLKEGRGMEGSYGDGRNVEGWKEVMAMEGT